MVFVWWIGQRVVQGCRDSLHSARVFFFSSRRRHTRFKCDWSSDVCSSDLIEWAVGGVLGAAVNPSWIPQPAQTGTYRTEIGRASCRGRVGLVELGDGGGRHGVGASDRESWRRRDGQGLAESRREGRRRSGL